MKTPLFMDRVRIFPFPSTKTALFMDRKRQPKAVLSGRRELNYVKALSRAVFMVNRNQRTSPIYKF